MKIPKVMFCLLPKLPGSRNAVVQINSKFIWLHVLHLLCYFTFNCRPGWQERRPSITQTPVMLVSAVSSRARQPTFLGFSLCLHTVCFFLISSSVMSAEWMSQGGIIIPVHPQLSECDIRKATQGQWTVLKSLICFQAELNIMTKYR